MDQLSNVLAITALILGFGFVVFIHELGHFLAAKWVGIRVEQFAVGFGHAVLAWRKGIGVRVGSTYREFEARVRRHVADTRGPDAADQLTQQQFDRVAAELGLGETEYRLNWLPLGGYVKMLGQDDMNPNAASDDPRAYNRKSIGARMVVVSAGVIMNVILAAILFMVVFVIGFDTQPALIGGLATNSPAQRAGLQVGDYVKTLDGTTQHSFDKLILNTALSDPDEPVPMVVVRDGKEIALTVQPERHGRFGMDLLGIGVTPSFDLAGLDPRVAKATDATQRDSQVLPGEVVVAINGEPVPDPHAPDAYRRFDEAIQKSAGKPVELTVREAGNPSSPTRLVRAQIRFSDFFGDAPFAIAGLQPRMQVEGVPAGSPVEGKLKRGDVIHRIAINGEPISTPTLDQFIEQVGRAGDRDWRVDFTVERDGKLVEVPGVVPSAKTGRRKKGVGIAPGYEEARPVISGVVEGSAPARAGVRKGSLITHVDGQPVATWFDVHQRLKASATGSPVITVVENYEPQPAAPAAAGPATAPSGTQPATAPVAATSSPVTRDFKLDLSERERQTLAAIRYTHELALRVRLEPRKTSNPLTAAAWGAGETWDMLRQFYVTLRRLAQGSVPASNLMGPVGIVQAGSLFALKGNDWLIWFLAMISANLAVVNFLPIPIVDGGLFAFLILEKVMGRPLSPRAQTVVQLVGLAMILSVFVFVTYNDIARLLM